MDVLGQVLRDFYHHRLQKPLILHNSYGEAEEMPAKVFFRRAEDLPDLEAYALSLCRGKILDIGAGAGSHTLILQERGFEVTAMDISKDLADLMRERGAVRVIHADIFDFKDGRFQTLLMLMNGIGLAGTLEGLKTLLDHLKTLLLPGGQLLFDSSDIGYLYSVSTLPADMDYGEIDYQFEYDGRKGNWFKWLYLSQEKLKIIGAEMNWNVQIIYEDDMDHYLARLTCTED